MRLVSFFIPLWLLFIVGSANAYECTFDGSSYYITADPVVISSNANAGAKIGAVISSPAINYMTGCSSTVGIYNSMFQFSAIGGDDRTIYDGRYVYTTGIAGLGVAIGASIPSCARTNTGGLEQWAGTGSGVHLITLCSSSSTLANPNYRPTVLIQFYKMGAISASTTSVTNLFVGQALVNINSSTTDNPRKSVFLTVKVIQGSCSISTPNISVDMGTIYKTELDNSTDLTAGTAVPFTVGVSCSTAVPVTMQIDGANGNATPTVMGIILPDTSIINSATGVGIQISKDGKAFPLGKAVSLGTLTGDNIFNFSAKYAIGGTQSGGVITVGKLKASATITLKYQ